MKWKMKIVGAVTVTALLFQLSSVQARNCDPCNIVPDVTATFNGMKPAGYWGVKIRLYDNDSDATGDYAWQTKSQWGGIFSWTGDKEYFFQEKLSAADTKKFISFCLEVNQSVNQDDNKLNKFKIASLHEAPVQANDKTNGGRVEPMGQNAADAITKLWGFKMPDLLPEISTTPYSKETRINVAAMQLAIWELATDQGDFDLTAGHLRVFNPSINNKPNREKVVIYAEQFYTESLAYYAAHPHAWKPTLVALTNPCYQDQVVALVP